jgi:hypothetical protein
LKQCVDKIAEYYITIFDFSDREIYSSHPHPHLHQKKIDDETEYLIPKDKLPEGEVEEDDGFELI